MGGQLAKLYLRGNLVNETTRVLSKDQMLEVEALINEAWRDPAIQSQKMEFCMALGRTVGNEYKDVEVGKQDAMIAFWKAALLVLVHESKQCKDCRKHYVTTASKLNTCECGGVLVVKWSPKPQIAKDPLKRKKFFQAVMFNYLKQILRENKPPSVKETHTEEGTAPDVAFEIIKSRLDKLKDVSYEVEEIDDSHKVIHLETGLMPLKTVKQILDARNQLEEHGVQISLDWKTIKIVSLLEIPPDVSIKLVEKVYAKFTSWDQGKGDDDNDAGVGLAAEYKASSRIPVPTDRPEQSEVVELIRSRLPDNAQDYFDLIINTPVEYVEQYGANIYKSHAAKFLGCTQEQIEEAKETIKLHCLAMGVGIA